MWLISAIFPFPRMVGLVNVEGTEGEAELGGSFPNLFLRGDV